MKVITIGIKGFRKYGIAMICILCLLLVGVTSPWVYGGAGKKLPIYRVKTEQGDNRIAITFDCAWGAQDIPEILTVLKNHDAKATFFVLGTWAEKNPEVMVSIVEAGHEVANHSYAHKTPTKLNKSDLMEEITKCNEAIYATTGVKATLYRAPSGDYNDLVVETAEELGFSMIQWDVDSIDWKEEMTKEAIYQRVISRTTAGSILLFHNDTNYTVEVLPNILQTLTEKGYESVTVSQLIYKDGYKIDVTGEQQKIP